MKITVRSIFSVIARLIIVLTAVATATNTVFIHLNTARLMPLGLSMTDYLSRYGTSLTEAKQQPFFAIFSAVMVGIVCIALLLSAVLCGINRGWLLVGALITLADCIGIGLLILSNGYRSGYWFELAGHAVIIAAFVITFFTVSRKKKGIAE